MNRYLFAAASRHGHEYTSSQDERDPTIAAAQAKMEIEKGMARDGITADDLVSFDLVSSHPV